MTKRYNIIIYHCSKPSESTTTVIFQPILAFVNIPEFLTIQMNTDWKGVDGKLSWFESKRKAATCHY